MLTYIQEVTSRFGGRYFGSKQEHEAQLFTADLLRQYCDRVEVEEFLSPLESHFQSLKGFTTIYILVLVLLLYNVRIAAVVGLLNSILFMGHFVTYRHWLDFLWPEKLSWNVIGDIEPQGTATSTLIIAGHIDSVKEFKWWFRLKQHGATLTVFSCVLIVLLGLYSVVRFFVDVSWLNHGWWFFALLSPALIVLFDMHGQEVVHGASDNLTGVAMAVEMAKVFSAERLKHTRLRVISFGAEEACLRGSWAYARRHKAQLLEEKAFLYNLDTIKDTAHLTIGTSETNTLVFYKKEYIQQVEDAFIAEGVPVKKLPLMVGASDASAFGIQGLPAICVIGMDSGRLDPAYHTRLDTIDCINPEALESMKRVLVRFVKTWDSK